MEVKETFIPGLFEIQPVIHGDDRGWFIETFNTARYENLLGRKLEFVQDNMSMSSKGILRGLHFQSPPMSQAKLVSCVSGSVLDVVVDIRSDSPSYGKHYSTVLTSDRHNQLFIPRGMAHGFLALEDQTIFSYKCDNYYSKEHEMTLKWDDQDLDIPWGIDSPIISEKDKQGDRFSTFRTPFREM